MKLSKPTVKQSECLALSRSADARINLWTGSVRSGKTINSLLAWALFCVEAPPGPLLMAGRTFATLKRNVLDPAVELFGEDNVRVGGANTGAAKFFGRHVHVIGADNASAESRIRGLTLAGSYVDELTIVGGPAGEGWWQQLLSRHSVQGAKVFATTNPDHPNHWLLRSYIAKAQVTVKGFDPVRVYRAPQYGGLGLFHYHFTLDDNPALPVEYVESLKAGLSGVFYKRFIDGEWVAAEGSVFPRFAPGVVDVGFGLGRQSTVGGLVVGVDVGTTNDTHAVLVGVVGDELWVLGEKVISDKTLTFAEQVNRVCSWLDDLGLLGVATVVVDPAARAFRNEWRRQTNMWPWNAHNAVLPGVADLGGLFDRGLLRVDDTVSPVLVGEIQGYRWSDKASQYGKDEPLKENDHGVDALRYAVQSLKKFWEPWVVVGAEEQAMFVPGWMRNA